MPINLETICLFNNRVMSPSDARIWIDAHTEGQTSDAKNLEQKAIASIGRPLYEAFIRGYTIKQWQTDPRDLPASIITRLPVRLNFDTRYFNDRFEGLPLKGYHALFQSMIDSPLIKFFSNLDFFDIRPALPPNVPIVYTGPIDRYFDYAEGALNWRTLDFAREVHDVGDFQGISVMNYADEAVPFTRIHEFRHLHPERTYCEDKTILFKEFSRFAGRKDEPYYPVDTVEDKKRYLAYRDRSELERNVIFGGRLGTYRYLDMHQAIGAALNEFENVIKPHFIDGRPLKPCSL